MFTLPPPTPLLHTGTGTQSVFVFMLSGDETLVDGASFRKFCQERRSYKTWVGASAVQEEAYNVRVHYSSDVYDSTRLHRTDARWFYVGVTHEYMTNAKRQVATQRVEVDGLSGTRSDGDGIPYVLGCGGGVGKEAGERRVEGRRQGNGGG